MSLLARFVAAQTREVSSPAQNVPGRREVSRVRPVLLAGGLDEFLRCRGVRFDGGRIRLLENKPEMEPVGDTQRVIGLGAGVQVVKSLRLLQACFGEANRLFLFARGAGQV